VNSFIAIAPVRPHRGSISRSRLPAVPGRPSRRNSAVLGPDRGAAASNPPSSRCAAIETATFTRLC